MARKMNRRIFVSSILASLAVTRAAPEPSVTQEIYLYAWKCPSDFRTAEYIAANRELIGAIRSLTITKTYGPPYTKEIIEGELHMVKFERPRFNKFFPNVNALCHHKFPLDIVTKERLQNGNLITTTIENVWISDNKGLIFSTEDLIIIADRGPTTPQPKGGIFFEAERLYKKYYRESNG